MMIEKRLVQWYAADAGVDLDIAEREIVLTYVLRILSDEGLLSHLAFKGGTAIRKLYLGGSGRFSLDLDFTAIGDITPDTLVLDMVGLLHQRSYYGITFTIPSPDYYATADSCGAEVTYRHDWVTEGKYDWSDLSRLVRRDRLVAPDEIVQDVQKSYAFLRELTVEEARLAADPYGRERQVYRQLVDSLENKQTPPP